MQAQDSTVIQNHSKRIILSRRIEKIVENTYSKKFIYSEVNLGPLHNLRWRFIATLVITAFNIKYSQQELHFKCLNVSVFIEYAVLVETVTNDSVLRKLSLRGIHF